MTTLTINPRSLIGKAMSRGKSPKIPSQLYVQLPFQSASSLTLSLAVSTHFKNVQGIEGIQSIYIDNSSNPDALTITFDTGQFISCPAAAQAIYPIFFSGELLNCTFTSAGAVQASCIFLNTRETAQIWAAGTAGSGGAVTQGTVPWVVSGTVTATPTGTQAVSQSTDPWDVGCDTAGQFVAGWSPDVGNVGSVAAWHNSGGGVPNALNILSGIEANSAAPINNIGVGPSSWNPLGNSATSSASLLLAARTGSPGTGRVRVALQNVSATEAWIGPTSGVTAVYTGGFPLPANMATPITILYTGNIYAITASGTAQIAISEEF